MSQLIALMYHAIYSNQEEYELISVEDRPYAISLKQFEQHLSILEDNNIPVLSPKAIHNKDKPTSGVILTFDDGHSSFYKYAFPTLKARALEAIFFITTDLIDSREDFCDWDQLKEMADAQMLIQSHGQTHQFFADMTDEQSKSELIQSKEALEEHTQQKTFAISFPGGRFKQRDIDAGKQAGYDTFYTSKVGEIDLNKFKDTLTLPRLAIRHTTSDSEFLLMASADQGYLRSSKLKSNLKDFIKALLGNHLYHLIYKIAAR